MSFEWLYIYALPFMVILTSIVFVHELGHYLLARWNGVKIEVFSIGFGPEIFGFYDRVGTRWKFSAIPLGGYVRMFSDVDAASRPDVEKLKQLTEQEKEYSHHYKTVWQRIQISVAGPAANYIFGILLLAVLYTTVGQRIPDEDATIGFVASNTAASKAGIQSGDKIASVGDKEIEKFKELRDLIREHPNVPLNMVVERDGSRFTVSVTPEAIEGVDDHGKTLQVGQLGIAQGFRKVERGPIESMGYAIADAFYLTTQTLTAIGEMILGYRSADGLTGPIGIAKHTGEIATTDVATFFWFMAFLSINLGFINLLPIPVLDGGHLLFYIIEAIRGRPLSEKSQEMGFRVGLIIILGLFIFTTINDLLKIEMVEKVTKLFN